MMDDIAAVHPNTTIHMILDKLNTQKSKVTVGTTVNPMFTFTSRRRGRPGLSGGTLVLDPASEVSAWRLLDLGVRQL
jgi:hypothetical protein